MNKNFTYTLILFALLFGITLQSRALFAQEFVPLSQLAQELLRTSSDLNNTLQTTTDAIRTEVKDSEVISTTIQTQTRISDSVIKNSITESIDTITNTTQAFEKEKDTVVEEIKNSIKQDIDDSIITIRKETNTQAYELQRVIDTDRAQLFETVTKTIENITPTEVNTVTDLRQTINTSIKTIQTKLQNEAPNTKVTFEQSIQSIEDRLLQFENTLMQKRDLIESREGLLVFMDSDGDGLSDYDEIYIYKTNPDNAYTVSGDLNDGQKVAQRINPLSENLEQKEFQDPRDDRQSFVSESYRVEKVQLIKEENKKALVFEGTALPNTFITLYIFSTPIVVTVKTDFSGKWSYELNEELENGEHQIFVATVDSSGKIVARSNPILFTKTADAATLGMVGNINSTVSAQNFLKDNFILITLSILIVIVILGMMFIGNHRNIKTAISELKDEVNVK